MQRDKVYTRMRSDAIGHILGGSSEKAEKPTGETPSHDANDRTHRTHMTKMR